MAKLVTAPSRHANRAVEKQESEFFQRKGSGGLFLTSGLTKSSSGDSNSLLAGLHPLEQVTANVQDSEDDEKWSNSIHIAIKASSGDSIHHILYSVLKGKVRNRRQLAS